MSIVRTIPAHIVQLIRKSKEVEHEKGVFMGLIVYTIQIKNIHSIKIS